MLFPLGPVLLALLIALAFFTIIFIIAMRHDDNSLVDLAWSPAFILLALWSFLRYATPTYLQVLATLLVVIWGCRLYLHLLIRKRGKPEDFRYAAWRKQWGRSFVLRSYVQIYVLQAGLLTVIALPVLLVNMSTSTTLGWSAVVGALLWAFGFFWEAVSDYQLARFKSAKRNKGQIMTTGLWQYSRHPNYFGEAVQWWGVWLVALGVTGGWVAIVSPLLITVLLLHVSGVPMLERHWSKHAGYQSYAARTNAFFPWRPSAVRRRKA